MKTIADYLVQGERCMKALPNAGMLQWIYADPTNVDFEYVAQSWATLAKSLLPFHRIYVSQGEAMLHTVGHCHYSFFKQYGNEFTSRALAVAGDYDAYGNLRDPAQYVDEASRIALLIAQANRSAVLTKAAVAALVTHPGGEGASLLSQPYSKKIFAERTQAQANFSGTEETILLGASGKSRFRQNLRADRAKQFFIQGAGSPAIALSTDDLARAANSSAGQLDLSAFDDYTHDPAVAKKMPLQMMSIGLSDVRFEDGHVEIPIDDNTVIIGSGQINQQKGAYAELTLSFDVEWDDVVADWIEDLINAVQDMFDCY